MFQCFGKKWGTASHLIMLNILVPLEMIRNYKLKRQQAKNHESLRDAIKLVQKQAYSFRNAAAEEMWFLNLCHVG